MIAQEVLWTEKCGVCDGDMIAYRTGENGYNMPGTHLCDRADPDGCFKSYHDECFDKHDCPVHPAKGAAKKDFAAITFFGLMGAALWAYGMYLPGLWPGALYAMAGGFLLGCAFRAAQP